MNNQPIRIEKGVSTVRPETQVGAEINNLQTAHKELIERCAALRERLGCVSRETGKEPKEVAKPLEMLVPMAEQLREIGKMTGTALSILDDIAGSLEI